MPASSSHLSNNPSMITLILLTSFAAAGAMLLTPALPMMAQSLAITAEHVQLVVSVYLAGYALGMLPYGPFANRFGRKPTLYFGLVLAIIGALISVVAGCFQLFGLLVFGRLVTAVGASVGLKIAYTMVGDLYSGAHATRKIATLMLGFPVASAIAMTVGGFLTQHVGWYGSLYALVVYGIFLLVLSTRLPETASELDLDALRIKHIYRGYAREIFHMPMILSSLQVGMTCSILYVFAAKAPFLAINVLGLRPDVYGSLSFLAALGQATGLSLSIYFAYRLHQLQAMFVGLCALITAIILFILGFWLFGFSLVTFFLPVPLMFMGNSLVTSNATSYALSASHKRSYASALVNSLGLCIASGGVCFSNTLNFQNHWMVPLFFGAAALLALLWWGVLYRTQQKN
jgi:predicted MFS family arabinose efflux permease